MVPLVPADAKRREEILSCSHRSENSGGGETRGGGEEDK